MHPYSRPLNVLRARTEPQILKQGPLGCSSVVAQNQSVDDAFSVRASYILDQPAWGNWTWEISSILWIIPIKLSFIMLYFFFLPLIPFYSYFIIVRHTPAFQALVCFICCPVFFFFTCCCFIACKALGKHTLALSPLSLNCKMNDKSVIYAGICLFKSVFYINRRVIWQNDRTRDQISPIKVREMCVRRHRANMAAIQSRVCLEDKAVYIPL